MMNTMSNMSNMTSMATMNNMNGMSNMTGLNGMSAMNNMNTHPDAMEDEGVEELTPMEIMPPPPQRVYSSKKEALEAAHAFTKDYGYELVLAKPKTNKNGQIYKNYLECKRHRKPPSVRTRRSSVRMNCPMRIILAATEPSEVDGTYEIRHCGLSQHNHLPDDILTLPGHRKRLQRTKAEEISLNNLTPFEREKRTILAGLTEFSASFKEAQAFHASQVEHWTAMVAKADDFIARLGSLTGGSVIDPTATAPVDNGYNLGALSQMP